MRDTGSLLDEAARSLGNDDLVFAMAVARRQAAVCRCPDEAGLLRLKESALEREFSRRFPPGTRPDPGR